MYKESHVLSSWLLFFDFYGSEIYLIQYLFLDVESFYWYYNRTLGGCHLNLTQIKSSTQQRRKKDSEDPSRRVWTNVLCVLYSMFSASCILNILFFNSSNFKNKSNYIELRGSNTLWTWRSLYKTASQAVYSIKLRIPLNCLRIGSMLAFREYDIQWVLHKYFSVYKANNGGSKHLWNAQQLLQSITPGQSSFYRPEFILWIKGIYIKYTDSLVHKRIPGNAGLLKNRFTVKYVHSRNYDFVIEWCVGVETSIGHFLPDIVFCCIEWCNVKESCLWTSFYRWKEF